MVWYAPFTFTAGSTLSAEDLNKYLVSNMSATIGGRLNTDLSSTGSGAWIVTDAVNSAVPRKIVGLSTDEEHTNNPTSDVYVDITNFTPNPYAVSTVTGTQVLVVLGAANMRTNGGTITASAYLGFRVSGATTIAASDTRALRRSGYFPNTTTTPVGSCMGGFYLSGLNPGTNTFTMQVKKPGTSTIYNLIRPSIVVIPLD